MVTPQDFVSYHVKVMLKRFHLKGHTIGFHLYTPKLHVEPLKNTPPFSLGVKGAEMGKHDSLKHTELLSKLGLLINGSSFWNQTT